MSAETKAALEAAIEAHVRDEDDAIVIGYVLYIAEMSADLDAADVNSYKLERPAGQNYHSSLGLMHSMILDFTTPTTPGDDHH
ncbi:MAG: hypothetical protein Q8M65_03145 [Rhodoglobus sp.]|nr:hypothetical protein [Rhodoglobus sp.]